MRRNAGDLDLQKLVDSPNNRCFACGPANPVGLHLHFRDTAGHAEATFTPGEWHAGWQQVVHGGILAAVLDEAMAYVLYYNGIKGLTARMELRYREAVTVGDELRVEAHLVSDSRRLADIEANLLRDGKVVAEAKARFMKAGQLTADAIS